MEYTNDLLEKMNNRRMLNRQYARYYKKYFRELGGVIKPDIDKFTNEVRYLPVFSDVYQRRAFNRAENIERCLDFWVWDKYEKAKILDLQQVNRCKNTRFCPNCKVLEAAKYIYKITPIYEEMLQAGYHFYFLTLTIPSIKTLEPDILKKGVDNLYSCFRQFQQLYSLPLTSHNAFLNRSFDIAGGVRVLEITHNFVAGFHPHLHCIIALKNEIPSDMLIGKYKAKYSRKRKSFDFKNEVEVEIAKVWSLIYSGHWSRCNFENYNYNAQDAFSHFNNFDVKNLEVNFKELNKDGFKETFKYTVKSSEITSYNVFKCLMHTLYRRRVRQGFGNMYHLVCDNCIDDEGVAVPLPDACADVEPEQLLISSIKQLFTVYSDYKKISRFNAASIDEVIDAIPKD